MLMITAIIMILMSIMLPAIRATRLYSLEMGCKSNTRQIAATISTYENDCGALPYNGVTLTGNARFLWQNAIRDYLKIKSTRRDKSVLYCPGAAKENKGGSWATSGSTYYPYKAQYGRGCDYEDTTNAFTSNGLPGVVARTKSTMIRRPSKAGYLYEGYNYTGPHPVTGQCFVEWGEVTPTTRCEGVMTFESQRVSWHGKKTKASYVFYDGHVENHRAESSRTLGGWNPPNNPWWAYPSDPYGFDYGYDDDWIAPPWCKIPLIPGPGRPCPACSNNYKWYNPYGFQSAINNFATCAHSYEWPPWGGNGVFFFLD